MKCITLLVFIVLLMPGCAIEYKPPQNEISNYSMPHNSNPAAILEKSKKVLIQEGFEIQSSDDGAGFLSTAPKNWKVKPEQANCGKILALDYLNDPRTTTAVAFDVVVDQTNLTIRSRINGQYKPSALDEAIPLTCISHGGSLEYNLAYKILN